LHIDATKHIHSNVFGRFPFFINGAVLSKVINKVGENGVLWSKVGKYFYIRSCISTTP